MNKRTKGIKRMIELMKEEFKDIWIKDGGESKEPEEQTQEERSR